MPSDFFITQTDCDGDGTMPASPAILQRQSSLKKRRRLIFLLMVLILVGVGFNALRHESAPNPRKNHPDPNLVAVTPEEEIEDFGDDELPPNLVTINPNIVALIDELVLVDAEGPGVVPLGSSHGFIACEAAEVWLQAWPSHRKPKVSLVLKQLIQQGANAIPDLLGHLEDRRKTMLSVGGKDTFLMNMWFAHVHQSRSWHERWQHRDKAVVFKRMIERDGFRPKYTIRVGDLCFVALGQIVNRSFNVTQYIPSGNLELHAPAAIPSLAESVRADWGGLSAEQHRRSLEKDLRHPILAAEALKRLCFYYPPAGKEWAKRLMERPTYDKKIVEEFFSEELFAKKAPKSYREAMRHFEQMAGTTNARGVHFRLLYDLFWYGAHDDKHRKLLLDCWHELYPNQDAFNPTLSEVASFEHQIALLGALRPFPDPGFRTIMEEGALKLLAQPLWQGHADELMKALAGISSQRIDEAARKMRIRQDCKK